MAPRIVRTQEPSWMLAGSVACGLAATLLGVMLGQGLFNRVLHRPADPAHQGEGELEIGQDGGERLSADTSASSANDTQRATEQAPRVPVRVTRVQIVSCGDGDELDTAGERCDHNGEIERILRASLTKLGDCPAALIAGQNPTQVLSLGLRVDFARRIVVPVQGRASSVRDPLTFVACARQRGGMGPVDSLWQQSHAKTRYQYVIAMRFGPLSAEVAHSLDAGTIEAPTNSTLAASTPAVVADAGVTRRRLRPGERCPVPQGTAEDPCPGYLVTPPFDASVDDPTLAPPVTVFMGPSLPHSEPARVTWARALIRTAPRTGVVITRLPFNTPVTIEARSDNWYRVRWASGMGWVFGEAIGRGGDAGIATP